MSNNRRVPIDDGTVPTNLLFPRLMRKIRSVVHTTPVHEHTLVTGLPSTHFHPELKDVLIRNAAAKSHNAERSGSTVGFDDGELEGLQVGIPEG